jgi:crotonobetainyl-CoA:carnitine CoA-transferase CaiB-like acyl-CoA transferase
MKPGPLTALRLIEYSTSMAAAASGKMLADLGAQVVKVEPPRSGDPARYHGPFPHDIPDPERSGLFLYLNAN